MNRAAFLTAALAASVRLPGGDKIDPSQESSVQSLRVLLGPGEAQSAGDGTFIFNGRRFRGDFSYTPDTGAVVNTVPLEQYLYSVVPREMPASWPAAALEAQAIVARTYVLARSDPQRAYDLVPTQADQVYTGIDSEHPATSRAVDSTAGLALRYGGAFAQVMYSSCCGGHTESSANAWGGAPIPYLLGVPCRYCVASPWYRWKHEVPVQAVEAALGDGIAAVGALAGIAMDPPDSSGRELFWTFTGANGSLRMKASAVRSALGMRVLPSLLVHSISIDSSPTQATRTVTIEGGGLGHGVGLCQWGAHGMALTGADARAILTLYYPGTGLGNV